jgi:MscS family membrane protein
MSYINSVINYIEALDITNIIDLAVAIAIIILFLLLSPIIVYFVLKIFFKKDKKREIKSSSLYKGLRVFVSLLGVYIATKILILPPEQDKFCDKMFRVVLICTVSNTIAGVIELNEKNILRTRIKNKDEITAKDKFTVSMTSKIVRILLYITAFYLSLKEFNFDISSLAAGLGIGGAIVALAAQNIVKQVISGLALVSDKPFAIGDWVEIGNVSGSVIAITWRSTKLKTTEDTIVTIDNGVVVNSNIVNWGSITKRIYKSNLKIPLETDERTIEKTINRIKFILRYNNRIIGDTIVVGLRNIGDDGLNISIYLEYKITDYSEALKFKDNLNLTILNILETQGISLSYPGRNIYIKEMVKENNIKNNEIKQDKQNNYYEEKKETKTGIKPIRVTSKSKVQDVNQNKQ